MRDFVPENARKLGLVMDERQQPERERDLVTWQRERLGEVRVVHHHVIGGITRHFVRDRLKVRTQRCIVDDGYSRRAARGLTRRENHGDQSHCGQRRRGSGVRLSRSVHEPAAREGGNW
jgi:hypothetical protein